MKILVTGAEGFIGKNLVEFFSDQGYSVLSPTISQLDLTSSQAVCNYFKEKKINIIIHSATTPLNVKSYPPDVAENNLRMFFNLIREMKPTMKMINLGSGSEYSREYWHKNMSEIFFDQHVPADSHSFSKYLISKYIESNDDLDIICLRIFGIFGKYEDYRYKFISNSIAKNLLHLPIVINQNANYDYMYINDFYRVIKFFMHNDAKYKSYNVTPIKSIDLISIARIINSVSGFQSEIQVLNDGIVLNYTGDNERLISEMNELDITNYHDSIKDLYGYYKENIASLNETDLKEDKFLKYAKKLDQDRKLQSKKK